MMKKILALLLAAVMALACAASLAEVTQQVSEKVDIGTISINGAFSLQCGLPEGYHVEPLVRDLSQVVVLLSAEDKTQPAMMLSVAFDETYADVERMNDLSDEDFALLEKTFTDNDPDVDISYGETGLGTRLLIARQTEGEQDYISFLSIYKGYFVEFVLVPGPEAEDGNLSNEQLQLCIDFLTDLDFVPAAEVREAQMAAEDVAGKTVPGRVTYNQRTNELELVIMTPVVLDPAQVEAAQVGDTLTAGDVEVTLETKDSDMEGYITVGEYTELRLREDGYHIYEYEEEAQVEVGRMVVPFTDSIVLEDMIDPATGEILEENVIRTAEEFRALLTSDEGPTFDVDNVTLTFDEDGNLEKVYRFYAPWQ
ncbi:MAG: hypothetical protein IKH77_08480 [Clostridia bacterium]|nr:hypothetical protein [Clostridia bacterium]